MLAHLSGDDPKDFVLAVALVKAQFKHRVGQRGGDGRLDFNRLTFGQNFSSADAVLGVCYHCGGGVTRLEVASWEIAMDRPGGIPGYDLLKMAIGAIWNIDALEIVG
jgi:hypothetical protein